MMRKKKSSISISTELRKELAKFGEFGESYEDVIWKLIERCKKESE